VNNEGDKFYCVLFSNVSSFTLQQLNSLSKLHSNKLVDDVCGATNDCGPSLSLLLRFQRLFISKIVSLGDKNTRIVSHPGKYFLCDFSSS